MRLNSNLNRIFCSIQKVKCLTCIYQKFLKKRKKNLEEQNLNTVILLNPKNEEAIYSLAQLKLEASDYKTSKELNKKLDSLCKALCDESGRSKIEIETLSKR